MGRAEVQGRQRDVSFFCPVWAICKCDWLKSGFQSLRIIMGHSVCLFKHLVKKSEVCFVVFVGYIGFNLSRLYSSKRSIALDDRTNTPPGNRAKDFLEGIFQATS